MRIAQQAIKRLIHIYAPPVERRVYVAGMIVQYRHPFLFQPNAHLFPIFS